MTEVRRRAGNFAGNPTRWRSSCERLLKVLFAEFAARAGQPTAESFTVDCGARSEIADGQYPQRKVSFHDVGLQKRNRGDRFAAHPAPGAAGCSSADEARLDLSGRVQHVQHAEMPLIFVIKGREVFRRAQCEIAVEALAGSCQRHRGSNQHLEPQRGRRQRRAPLRNRIAFLSWFHAPKLLRRNSPSADQGCLAARISEDLSGTMGAGSLVSRHMLKYYGALIFTPCISLTSWSQLFFVYILIGGAR